MLCDSENPYASLGQVPIRLGNHQCATLRVRHVPLSVSAMQDTLALEAKLPMLPQPKFEHMTWISDYIFQGYKDVELSHGLSVCSARAEGQKLCTACHGCS